MNADLVKTLTDLAHFLAWPLVALVAMWRFTPELRGVLGRIRRAAGVELDPPAGQGTPTTPPSVTSLPANLPPLPPSAAEVISTVRAAPDFKALTDAQRVDQLLHFVAFLAFSADAERVEGQIWMSQVALLEHLNAIDAGDTLSNLKARFYDPAAGRFPPMFANYPFESYVSFLASNGLLTVDGGIAKITQKGQDYLAWRVQARKPPRVAG